LKGTSIYAENCHMELTFMNDAWQMETRRISFPGPHGSATVRLPFTPTIVMSDLYERAADATTDNYKTIKTTGLYDYPDTFFKIDVTQITDSAFVRATHNWVPPDSLHIPQPGLTLSDYRYWTIEGLFPGGFEATGRFFYNRNAYLDNNLLISSADSLVILYRPNAASDWLPVSFSRVGPWQIGTIYVPQLRPGDYTLAVWDEVYVGSNLLQPEKKSLKVYPNPANDKVIIETGVAVSGIIAVHDTAGKLVFSVNTTPAVQPVHWDCSQVQPGTYLVSFNTLKGSSESKKVVIKP
jgi:hypothetical protein